LENASLIELFKLAAEMFGNVTLVEGSILLFGSVSHLSRRGTSLYAKDWTELVAMTSNTWRGIRVCPLIPLITTDCPGPVIRELSELAVWLESVYGTDPQGMHGTWMRLVAAMEKCSTGTTSLDVMETYKIVMPSSLYCGTLDNVVTYCSNNSRPVTCNGLPKDSCSELLSSMLQEIHDNFRACQSPEIYLARADEKPVHSEEKKEQRVLLVGASNLKHSVPHFADATLTFANITTAGWIATDENVKNLITLINSRTQETDAFVFDLLGNSSIRFEQADGTTALPFKSNGRYHLGGDVVVTPPDIFTELVKRIIPLLKATGNKPSVIIPPLPRYLFARCCNDTDHCTNAAVPDFCKTLLSGFTEMRNSLIRQLVSSGLTNFRVMDICCTTECPVTACTEERIKGLRSVTAKDGVHFVDAGYRNMAGRCVDCLLKMLKKADDASSIQPGKSGSPTSFFWRGFRSPRGSSRFKKSHVWTPGIRGTARGRAVPARGRAKTPRGQLHQSSTSNYHPYRRW
jgi:lysophospholipase L1-like esterase